MEIRINFDGEFPVFEDEFEDKKEEKIRQEENLSMVLRTVLRSSLKTAGGKNAEEAKEDVWEVLLTHPKVLSIAVDGNSLVVFVGKYASELTPGASER